MAAVIKIDPLDGTNYESWKIHMRSILKKQKLWGYVTGETLKPEATAADANAVAKWKEMDGQVEGEILLALSPSELRQFDGLRSSKEIWDKIIKVDETRVPVKIAGLIEKLAVMKMQESDDVKKHVSDFTDTAIKLKESQVAIDERVLSILLMLSLPPSFNMFRAAIKSRDAIPDLENMKAKILEENESYNSSAECEGQGAMYSKKQYNNNRQGNKFHKSKNQGQKDKKNFNCHRCGHPGHFLPGIVKQIYPQKVNQSKVLISRRIRRYLRNAKGCPQAMLRKHITVKQTAMSGVSTVVAQGTCVTKRKFL